MAKAFCAERWNAYMGAGVRGNKFAITSVSPRPVIAAMQRA